MIISISFIHACVTGIPHRTRVMLVCVRRQISPTCCCWIFDNQTNTITNIVDLRLTPMKTMMMMVIVLRN